MQLVSNDTDSADDADYDRQLISKLTSVTSCLQDLLNKPPSVYRSTPSGYRMRAEFRVWHQGEQLDYVMFPKGDPRSPYPIKDFAYGAPRIQELMPQLLDAIRPQQTLRRKLFQVDFLANRDGDCVVSLLYHRALDDEWRSAATKLQSQLNIAVIGRSRKQREVLSVDHVIESFRVAGKTLRYQHVENCFTQPNAGINEQMLDWAYRQTTNSKGDLLEIYCGNANFSIALADNFDKVLATELSKASTRSAQFNIDANGVHNIALARLSASEVAAALAKRRTFRRLQHVMLDDYHFNTVLVDPPRAGLDDASRELVRRFPKLIYVSCNPASLACDLVALRSTHKVVSAAIFDQFPFTEHVESAVVAVRS